MTRYVVGFVTRNRNAVLLQRKAKPKWQEGRLNGPGGKIEEGETPEQAVAREIAEETTLTTKPEDWRHYATLRRGGPDGWEVLFLHHETSHNLYAVNTRDEKEPLVVVLAGELAVQLPEAMIQNLKWLVPLAFDNTIKTPVVVEDTYP